MRDELLKGAVVHEIEVTSYEAGGRGGTVGNDPRAHRRIRPPPVHRLPYWLKGQLGSALPFCQHET